MQLTNFQDKMEEYRANSALLGWLSDRKNRTVHIYHLNHELEILDNPEIVNGKLELPGFVLRMA